MSSHKHKSPHSVKSSWVERPEPVPAPGRGGWLRFYAPLIAITVLASILLLANLGNIYLWQDEAQTALVSRTILHQGIPHGYDGRNFFSQDAGREYGTNYIWKWHTWVMFYATAPFLALVEDPTLAARLPFAMFGLGTVVFTYLLALTLWRSHKAAVFAGLLLATSVPFLLLSRQCRYYAPAMFFTVLAFYAYARYLDRKRWSLVLYVISSLLLLHTHYGYAAALFATVFAHALVFHRARASKIIAASVAVTVANILPLRFFMSIDVGDAYGDYTSFKHFVESNLFYGNLLAKHVLNPVLLVIPFGVYVARLMKQKHWVRLDRRATSYTILLVVFSVITCLAFAMSTPVAYLRTLAPLIPLACVVIALILDRVHVVAASIIFAVMLLASPVARQVGAEEYTRKNDIGTYLYEITHDYNGPVEGVVRYLNAHANPKDVVLITYEDLTVKYYTNLRVLGGLTGEDLSDAKHAEWIIIRNRPVGPYEKPVFDFLATEINAKDYQPIKLDCTDTFFENREDPDDHMWKSPSGEPKVVIYKRIKATERNTK